MEIIPNKVYEHYKGGKYIVLSVAEDTTNKRAGTKVIVYAPLDQSTVYCRDLSEFTEVVEWPSGEKKARFVAV